MSLVSRTIPSMPQQLTPEDIERILRDHFEDLRQLAMGEKGLVVNISAVSTTYIIVDDDDVIICDATSAAFTVTLPVAADNIGKTYHIKKIDISANAITVDGNGSETIDDGATAIITTQYECITVVSDGTEWWIV